MNPFDWSGPGFLLFYVGLVVATLLVLRAWRRWREGGPAPAMDLADPYLVAYLRGQHSEAVRIALVALLDRGLVRWDGTALYRSGDLDVAQPLERAIGRALGSSSTLAAVQRDGGVQLATHPLRDRLEHARLLPDRTTRDRRRLAMMLAIAGLVLIAGVKIAVGVARERPVGLLVVLTGLASWAMFAAVSSQRTVLGDQVLADLRTLLGGLRDQTASLDAGGLVLAAAAFGVGALPQAAFAHHGAVAAREGVAWSGATCGSSGSSSCASSCSSGGGDGGGGGCGGCGGGD